MPKKLFQKWGWSAAAVFLGGIIITTALLLFNISTINSLEQLIHCNMEETNQAAITSMNYGLKSFIERLEQQAKMMTLMQDPNDDKILASLATFSADERFERVTLIMAQGKGYSSTYGLIDEQQLKHTTYTDSANTLIHNPRISSANELVVDIGTPFYRGGKRIGRLFATIDSQTLGKMYTSNSLQGDAGLTLVTANGMVITSISPRAMSVAVRENIFEHLRREDLKFELNTPEQVFDDIQNGRSGWLKYQQAGHSFCTNYQPFGINGWYMGITATDNTVDLQAGNIRHHAILLTVTILLTVVIVSTIIMVQHLKQQKRMDVLKNTYSVAIRKTNDLFYEADIDKDRLVDYSEDNEKAIWKETPKNYSSALEQIADVCAPECRQLFLDTFLPQNIKIKIKEGISSINLEYKITPDEHTVRWLSATLVPVIDRVRHSTKLICMENDITDQMLRQERLKRSATLDGLTGLYNKVTTQSLIDRFLEEEGQDGKHAFLLLDIDCFKAINDTLGHAKGDEVLALCSDTLRKIFRSSDIVGRIGGDEFVVLVKNYGSVELVAAKAAEVCDGFRGEHFLPELPERRVAISASIGIAYYSSDGIQFDALYKNADTALYAAKERGKDSYVFFEDVKA